MKWQPCQKSPAEVAPHNSFFFQPAKHLVNDSANQWKTLPGFVILGAQIFFVRDVCFMYIFQKGNQTSIKLQNEIWILKKEQETRREVANQFFCGLGSAPWVFQWMEDGLEAQVIQITLTSWIDMWFHYKVGPYQF